MRAWLDTDAKVYSEFTTQVARSHEKGSAEEGQDIGNDGRVRLCVQASKPAYSEQSENKVVACSMNQTDRFGARAGGDMYPVDGAGYRCPQATQRAFRFHPGGDGCPVSILGDPVNNVEDRSNC